MIPPWGTLSLPGTWALLMGPGATCPLLFKFPPSPPQQAGPHPAAEQPHHACVQCFTRSAKGLRPRNPATSRGATCHQAVPAWPLHACRIQAHGKDTGRHVVWPLRGLCGQASVLGEAQPSCLLHGSPPKGAGGRVPQRAGLYSLPAPSSSCFCLSMFVPCLLRNVNVCLVCFFFELMLSKLRVQVYVHFVPTLAFLCQLSPTHARLPGHVHHERVGPCSCSDKGGYIAR